MIPVVEMGKVGVAVLDCEHKTPLAQVTGYAYIAIPQIQSGRIETDDARKISKADLAEWTRKTKPVAGDVVVTRRGRVGDAAPIPPGLECAIGQNLVLLRSDGSSVDQGYLRWALQGSHWRSEVERMQNVGAIFNSLNVSDIPKMTIPLPSLREQKAIAAVLDALESKAASAKRARELVSQVVQAEFQRLIKGGSIARRPLAELVQTAKGVSYRSSDLNPSRTALVTLKSFERKGGYKSTGLKPYTGSYRPAQEIAPGELVVAQTDLTQGAEVVGRTVRVPAEAGVDKLIASLDLVIVRPVGELSPEYLQGVLSDEEFRQHCRSRTSGTTVLHLSGDAIPSYMAPMVPNERQQKYASFVRPLQSKADGLTREIEATEALLGSLLVAFLSGTASPSNSQEASERAAR